MYAVFHLVFFYNFFALSTAYLQCCPGDNIYVNHSCLDGANLTKLHCKETELMGPTMKSPRYLNFGEDDQLEITDDRGIGSIFISPEEYCVTRNEENGTELALVCLEEEEPESLTTTIFFYLRAICAIISIVFLLAIFIIYWRLPELHDTEGKSILQMIGALTTGYLVFSITPLLYLIKPEPCIIVTFVLHACLLCCSSWLCVLSFHFWRITMKPFIQTRYQWFRIYCCYGYGVPLLLVVTSITVHYTRNRSLETEENECDVEGSVMIFTYFYGPATIMNLLCIGLQCWAAKIIWWDHDRKDCSPSLMRLRKKSLMYLHVLLILGVIQILDLMSYVFFRQYVARDIIWDIIDCRNCLVGGVLFFIFVVLRSKVLKALAKRGLCCFKFPQEWERLVDEENEETEAEERALARDSASL